MTFRAQPVFQTPQVAFHRASPHACCTLSAFDATKSSSAHDPKCLSACLHVDSGNGASLSTRRTCAPANDFVHENRSHTICAPNGTCSVVRNLRLLFTGPLGEIGGLSFASPSAVSARSIVVSCPNSR